jgi:hypothetical protein
MKTYPGTVYDRPDYKKLRAFNDELLDENSCLVKIISRESVRQSSELIREAIIQTIVNNGHGVRR